MRDVTDTLAAAGELVLLGDPALIAIITLSINGEQLFFPDAEGWRS